MVGFFVRCFDSEGTVIDSDCLFVVIWICGWRKFCWLDLFGVGMCVDVYGFVFVSCLGIGN